MPSIMAIVGANISAFEQQMDEASRIANKTGTGIEGAFGGIANKLLGTGGGFVSMVATFAAAQIAQAAEYAGHIEDIHARTTVARESLQAWDLVMKQNGGTVDEAIGFFEKLAVARQKAFKGDDDATKAFAKLGVSIDDLKNKRIEDIAADIGKAFGEGDPQKLFPFLKEVGGKGAGAMIPAFRSDFEESMTQAEGLVMSKAAVKELDAAGDWWTRAKFGMRSMFGDIAGGVISRVKDVRDLAKGELSLRDAMLNRGAAMRDLREGGDKAFGAITEAELPETEEQKKAKKEREKRIEALNKKIEAERGQAAERADDDRPASERLEKLRTRLGFLGAEIRGETDEERRLNLTVEKLHVEELISKVKKDAAREDDKADRDAIAIADIKRNAKFKTLTATEQERMLEKEIIDLKKIQAEAAPGDTEGRAFLDKRLAERESDLLQLRHKRDRVDIPTGATIEGGGFLGGYGMYMSAPENAMLETQKKSEAHLQVIATHVETVANAVKESGGFSDSWAVQF